MGNNEKGEDSPNNIDFSTDVFQDHSEEVCRNSTRAVDENLPSMGELALENQCLFSLRSTNVSSQLSNQSPIPSSQIPNDYSHNKEVFISPRQQPMASYKSGLEDLDACNAKINQKDLSPFASSRNADYTSPPEPCTTPLNRWLSKNLKETSTPSPEKRSVETDEESTLVKRLRKTPESGSGKPRAETESHTPKLSHSAISETFYKSLHFHFQQLKEAIQKDEESKSQDSPSTHIKRKGKITRNSSIESKTANDPTLSNSISPSSPANVINTSPSCRQMQGSKVGVGNADESPTERKIILEDPLASCEVLQSDLPVKETTSAVHPFSLSDKTSCANPRQASESRISNKIQNSSSISAKGTQSASNVGDSTVETQILESSLFSSVILNPHLPSSCHLPRQSNSSVTNVPGSILELDTFDKKKKKVQNRSDYSTRTSTPERSMSQSRKLPSSRNRGIHRRSVSDETLTTRNVAEVQAERNQPNSVIKSQSKQAQTSRSFPDISKTIGETITVVQPLCQGMFARSASNTAFATSNHLEFFHSDRSNQLTRSLSSNQSSMSRSNPELQMHQNLNAPLLQSRHPRFFSDYTCRSRSQLEGASDITRPYINVVERQAYTLNHQPVVTIGSSFDQASTSRNQSKVAYNLNPTHINVPPGQTSTWKYQPIASGVFSSLPFYPSAFPTARNEPDIGELFAGREHPSTEDSSSSDEELDSSESVCSSDDRPEKHPECVVQARLLLQSVLKEIMLYNKEDLEWSIFEKRFRRIAKECSEFDSLHLIADLGQHLADKALEFFDKTLFSDYEMAEKHTIAVYGKLTVIVIETLAFTLSVGSSRVFFRILQHHMRFRSLYDNFLRSWDVFSVESIRNEATRNSLKTLRKMIQRLMLVVLAAFRLLLMYVGANISEIYFGIFEIALSGEDKMYFFSRKIA